MAPSTTLDPWCTNILSPIIFNFDGSEVTAKLFSLNLQMKSKVVRGWRDSALSLIVIGRSLCHAFSILAYKIGRSGRKLKFIMNLSVSDTEHESCLLEELIYGYIRGKMLVLASIHDVLENFQTLVTTTPYPSPWRKVRSDGF
ncbi:hypothetical protein VNO77_01863 [Canavalia gladiata]|uniref:Uncharacterized protein n=1 Tax=Canavalia gladiata TaxID=3824 RepID=A0AAN9MSN7_CANGL